MELLLYPTEFEYDPKPEDIPAEAWDVLQMHAAVVRRYELPLLSTLKQAYPERFPRVCGPASIALAHVLSSRLNVPITDQFDMCDAPPHLRLRPWLFNPDADPQWGKPDEHTFLEDHTGTGYSLTIDPTIRLQHGAPLAPGVMRIEWHESHQAAFDMAWFVNMHKPDPFYDQAVPRYFADQPNLMHGFRDMTELLHSSAVFEETVVTAQGSIHEIGEYWGHRLRGVIEHVLEVCD